MVFLSAFASGDSRDEAGGRKDAEYDAEIHLHDRCVSDLELSMAPNGYLLAREPGVPRRYVRVVFALDAEWSAAITPPISREEAEVPGGPREGAPGTGEGPRQGGATSEAEV